MLFDEILEFAPALAEYTEFMPDELKNRVSLKRYEPYTIIHQKDSILNQFGVVIRGEHRVINEFENGSVFMIEKNQAISFIGEVTLLAGAQTTSVTIETITECYIMQMSIPDFWLWVEKDHHFLYLLSRNVSRKLYHSSYNKGERHYYSAKYLLLKYIVKQAELLHIEKKKRVVVAKTRQEISEEIGMSAKTINRTLSNLVSEHMIEIQKGKITLTREHYKKSPEHLGILIKQAKNGLAQ